MEFLTNPYVNALLEALMEANGTMECMAKREGMREALAPTIAFARAWADQNAMEEDEAESLLESALYPYKLT